MEENALVHKLCEAEKLIYSWTPNRPREAQITAHMVCLVEEVGEAIEAYEADDQAAMFDELCDVVIAANMMHIILIGRTVKPKLRAPLDTGSPRDRSITHAGSLLILARDVAKVAEHWRQLSGMRARASRNPSSLADLEQALRVVVGRAYLVNPYVTLPVEAKLDAILARGSGLSASEKSGIRTIPTHTGAKPGTVHVWGAC